MTNSPVPQEKFVHPENFVDGLRQLAADRPEDVALTVVAGREGEIVETVLTYRAFAQRVLALAALLQARYEKGDRILILLDNDEYYAVSMFACFHAGVIAVPAFPPESARPQHLARLAGIVEDSQARGVLTTGALRALVGEAARQFDMLDIVAVDEVDPAEASRWQPQRPDGADVAFLQYTSGSTSAPKGVMVTHANLMANERAIREGLSIGAGDKFGVWSPLFHDMGLIGGLLQPFYSGIPCVLSSPRFFLERPVRWLEMISRHRITISGGPDFAYRLCLDRVKDANCEGLDLSSWRVAYTGAEPVRQDTMEAFVERFAPMGFSAGAVYPCYGLAEATLFVTGGRRGSGMAVGRYDNEALSKRLAVAQADGAALVGCGSAAPGHELRIVDTQSGEPAAQGAIGEIWAAGPSVAAGYWNNPSDSAETFVERDGHRWLRTGDLGFVDGGELFVAGRHKDMIIVRGHNLYPQDIERVVEEEVEAVRKGRVAAFAVELDGQEGIGVAAEVSRGLQKLVPPQALVDALGAAVSGQCGEAPRVVVLLQPGALPKTSSGKLQRTACRKGWAERTLDAYALYESGRFLMGGDIGEAAVDGRNALPEDQIQPLANVWRDVLGHETARRYSSDAHFFTLGGNSLAAMQLAARISQTWETDFPVRQVFESPRLGEQAAALQTCLQIGSRKPFAGIPVLSAECRSKPLPLSSAQQRQWFLWRLTPHSTAYHVQGALRIAGLLDVDALRAAVAGLITRHETLRTIFRARPDGEAEQMVLPGGTLELQVVDLRTVTSAERDAQAAQTLRAFLAPPFDLTAGPLARAALMRLDDQVHVLALAMHHIISDGASMQVLVDDLAALYAADEALPACSIQYADYASWQRDDAVRDAQDRQLAYWVEQLAMPSGESQPGLALPADHPRLPVAQYRAGLHTFELPAELLAALRCQAEVHGATLFMALLASLQALLHRHTGQRDVRVGVPVANRPRAELQGVVGIFVNTVVLQSDIEMRQSLAQVLAQVRERVLGAQANQEAPFEQVVEALRPARSAGTALLFDVMFNHSRRDYSQLQQRSGWRVTEEPTGNEHAQFELAVDTVEDVDGRLVVTFRYAVELFDAATIARMAGHYVAMLGALADAPEQAVGDVKLLSDAEGRKLRAWGESPLRSSRIEPVHRQIEQHVRAHPRTVALWFGEESVSYEELNRRSNRLAHRLIGLGVKPETRVGIAMERSIEMVAGLLAILKAGGAYVPLDPELPAERLEYMLEDSGIELLLTQSGIRGRLPADKRLQVLEVDALDLGGEREHDPGVAVHGENLAYVIYTSGSTGRPKGAAIRHRSLAICMSWMQQTYGLTAEDVVLHKAPFGFDVSVWEIFWPLTTGVRLVVAAPGDHREPERITALIRRHQITTLNFVPAMLQAFLAHEGIETQTRLRYVMCGGEAMSAAMQSEALRRLRGVSLQNLYGPTETTIHVTQWKCRDDGQGRVPIGRPIAQTKSYVLDASLNLVPQGVEGELYIGGDLLGRGYLGRPGLSAERFVADPFDETGGRLYRTGDLARWNGEGQLEFLGRTDHQVKIRGLRIELGEVEAQLLALPEIREAVVVDKGARLVAYVSLAAEKMLDVRELRARLARVLPDYMVPGVIVSMESLPLNANGKVDRRALPEPETPSFPIFEEPAGEVEAVLAQLWNEALGVESVDRNDNFFELGGHSLIAVRMAAILANRYAFEVPVRMFFEAPILRDFALRLSEQGTPDAGSRQDRLALMHNLMSEFEV
ncbi:amino acid adenylation domain protein 2 [Achromobacter xylosoxidans A8]|uniref:Amino acid adenylation domain protein 2 n=1 Tax=Achromobacter xylosoxidans (strain A8) TaxID=762376 RepID=E3HPT2_ACHXA|nr:non-ribosomal peptide synthetase [Achromobacter xylosoxidans]ADP15916.1 amino acid adenylation domain protein 2 [Achromobacter xylosoxidans A8]